MAHRMPLLVVVRDVNASSGARQALLFTTTEWKMLLLTFSRGKTASPWCHRLNLRGKKDKIIWETDPLKWCKSLWRRWNTLFCLWRCVSLFFTTSLHSGRISRLRLFSSFFFFHFLPCTISFRVCANWRESHYCLDQARIRVVRRIWYRWQTASDFQFALIRQRIIIIYGLELIADVMRVRPPSRHRQFNWNLFTFSFRVSAVDASRYLFFSSAENSHCVRKPLGHSMNSRIVQHNHPHLCETNKCINMYWI